MHNLYTKKRVQLKINGTRWRDWTAGLIRVKDLLYRWANRAFNFIWNSPRCSVLLFAQWGFIRSTSSLFYANKPYNLAKVVGIEPTSQGFGDLRITVFPHRLINLVRMKGLEPPRLSTLVPKTRASTIPPHPHGAGYGNRTRVVSLEG